MPRRVSRVVVLWLASERDGDGGVAEKVVGLAAEWRAAADAGGAHDDEVGAMFFHGFDELALDDATTHVALRFDRALHAFDFRELLLDPVSDLAMELFISVESMQPRAHGDAQVARFEDGDEDDFGTKLRRELAHRKGRGRARDFGEVDRYENATDHRWGTVSDWAERREWECRIDRGSRDAKHLAGQRIRLLQNVVGDFVPNEVLKLRRRGVSPADQEIAIGDCGEERLTEANASGPSVN